MNDETLTLYYYNDGLTNAERQAVANALATDPEVMTFALEEFLRAYAPVTMARLVKEDHDFHGCPMKANDWVLLPFPAANRDPAQFERATEFVIDRQVNRHGAFGLGIHRCLGSNLARLELKVAIEEFVQRFQAEASGFGNGFHLETHG